MKTERIKCDMENCEVRGKYAYCQIETEQSNWYYKNCMFYDCPIGRGESKKGGSR